MTQIKRFQKYEDKLREKYGEPNHPIFTISGLSGVGKTTISKLIAENYNLDRINAGDFFRKEAKKRGMDIYEFMDKIEGIEKKEDRDFDVECDKYMFEMVFKNKKTLIESRLSGILLYDIADIRIWIICPPKIVAERIAKRDNKRFKDAFKAIKNRNKSDKKRYKEKYGIDVTNTNYYNLVIDSSEEFNKMKRKLFNKIDKKLK